MKIAINSLGVVLTVFGTILTLWTTFTTRTKEAGTLGEMFKRHDEFPKEKKRVIFGCSLIVLGGIAQIVSQFIC